MSAKKRISKMRKLREVVSVPKEMSTNASAGFTRIKRNAWQSKERRQRNARQIPKTLPLHPTVQVKVKSCQKPNLHL